MLVTYLPFFHWIRVWEMPRNWHLQMQHIRIVFGEEDQTGTTITQIGISVSYVKYIYSATLLRTHTSCYSPIISLDKPRTPKSQAPPSPLFSRAWDRRRRCCWVRVAISCVEYNVFVIEYGSAAWRNKTIEVWCKIFRKVSMDQPQYEVFPIETSCVLNSYDLYDVWYFEIEYGSALCNAGEG